MSGAKTSKESWKMPALAALALGALTLLTYFGVWGDDFVDYDDNEYVYLNGNVQHGLDWQTVKWAFTQTSQCDWHPLTWLSHALDCQLYGLNPGGHHVTSLLFHTANTVLLFLLLRALTGSFWKSAMVAGLFGVHPLHVESVAWVAERKDVLSGFFFLLTLLAYGRYARIRTEQELSASAHQGGCTPPGSSVAVRWYGLSLLLFALGLMSKPMLVTLPFVLLLLDWWPLGRIRIPPALPLARSAQTAAKLFKAVRPLLKEKAPFFVLAFLSCVITYAAQDYAISGGGLLTLPSRLANAILAYAAYLQQLLWPAGMSVFYPLSTHMSGVKVLVDLALLAVVTVAALWQSRRQPVVAVGWFWFIGMLVPVIGIMRVGAQAARADRYTYLPSIGLFLTIVWALAEAAEARPRAKLVLSCLAPMILGGFALQAHRQAAVWRDTSTLFAHAAEVTPGNYTALVGIANVEAHRGQLAAAIANLEGALRIAPGYAEAEYLMGEVLQREGKMQEAVPHLLAGSRKPGVEIPSKARLVLSYIDAGKFREAESVVAEVLRLAPNDPNALLMKAVLLREQGEVAEAMRLFDDLVAQQAPFTVDNPTLSFELATLYSLRGDSRQAVVYYSKAVEISPQFTNALNDLAWVLATDADPQVRNGARAMELGERACQLTRWSNPLAMGTLAASYAEVGRYDEAVKMAERACATAKTQRLDSVAARNEELLRLYHSGKPCREQRAGAAASSAKVPTP